MIKFINYDGEYPNLCSGVLTVNIDGTEYKFGHHYSSTHYNSNSKKWEYIDEDPKKPNYPEFWQSGGCVFEQDGDWFVDSGEWKYNGDLDKYTEFTEDIIKELIKVFNYNVRQGCCGGCI